MVLWVLQIELQRQIREERESRAGDDFIECPPIIIGREYIGYAIRVDHSPPHSDKNIVNRTLAGHRTGKFEAF